MHVVVPAGPFRFVEYHSRPRSGSRPSFPHIQCDNVIVLPSFNRGRVAPKMETMLAGSLSIFLFTQPHPLLKHA